MSYPTKQIDGDVAVGRNVTMGGNAIVRGSSTIGHNLRVNGWLDAPNIKGPNKGIFLDVAKLREAYPLPHDGWWALVGNSLPAPLYIADGGEWVATGQNAGNPTVDSEQYNEAVAALDADLKALAAEASSNKQSIEQIRTQINTIGIVNNSLTNDVASLNTRMGSTETDIQEINNSKGKADGLAPLDGSGRVPSSYLPSYVDDVVEFDVIDPDSDTYLGCYPEVPEPYDDASTYSLQYDSLEGLTGVRYAPGRGFAAGERVAVYSGHNRVGVLYINSEGQDLSKFGDAADDGFVTPVAGKIYVAVTTDKQYRWGGSQLAELSGPTPIGDGWNEAFQGSAGAELQAKVNQLESDVSVRKGDLMYITAGWVFPVSADSTPMTLDEALDYVAGNIELLARWALPFYGWVISFVSDSGWKYYRYISSVDSNYSAEEIAEALRAHASWEQVDMGTGGSGGSGGSDDTGGNGNACSCEQCDANAAALSTLSGRVTAAESAVENAKAAANAAKSAADGAASAVEDMSATVDALGADVTEAQAAANLAKTTAISAKTAADNAASDVEGLTTEVGALKTTVDSLGSGGTATDSVEFLDTTEATGYTQGAHTSGLTYLYPEAGAQLNLRAKPSAQDILLMLPVEESFAGKIFRVLDPRRLSSTEKASAKSVHITTYSADYKIYGTTKASDDFWISLKGGYVELLAVKTVAGQSGVTPRVEWVVKQLVEF